MLKFLKLEILFGSNLVTGVLLGQGHKMIMLMAEDKALQVEQVDHSGVNLRFGPGKGGTSYKGPVCDSPSTTSDIYGPRKIPSLLGGLIEHCLLYRTSLARALLDHANQPVISPFSHKAQHGIPDGTGLQVSQWNH